MSDLHIRLPLTARWVMRGALLAERDRLNRHHAITECRLAAGLGNAETLIQLARHEEVDLAAVDDLLTQLDAT